jgi:hypothetical protein
MDDGIYIISGKALSIGQGYVLPSRPVLSRPNHAIGFPLLLASTFRILKPADNLVAARIGRIVVLSCAWILFCAVFVLFTRICGRSDWSLLVVLAVIASSSSAIVVMSDIPFAAVVFGVLLLIAESDQPSVRIGLIAGFFSGFAFLLRGNGIALIAACVAAFLYMGPIARVPCLLSWAQFSWSCCPHNFIRGGLRLRSMILMCTR